VKILKLNLRKSSCFAAVFGLESQARKFSPRHHSRTPVIPGRSSYQTDLREKLELLWSLRSSCPGLAPAAKPQLPASHTERFLLTRAPVAR
ncbi:MAG: hypothetical protein ACK5MO_21120, partial [Planctomyces sp.]